jgi:hypothetical protein
MVSEPPPISEPEPKPEPEFEPLYELFEPPPPFLDIPTEEPPPPLPAITEPINFVNPLDIFNAPPPPPLPLLPIGDLEDLGKKEPDPEPMEDSITVKPIEPTVSVKASPSQEAITVNTTVPKQVIKQEPKSEPVRIKSSPHSSVTNSPALSTRSPGITKRSPAPKPRINTIPIMVAIAEECFEKARNSVHDVAMSLDPDMVDEYQKLIATSLSCLETAVQNNKLAPREEARLRMRYAAVLHEETDNLMEAEMALGKGISLCDKVWVDGQNRNADYVLTIAASSNRLEIQHAVLNAQGSIPAQSQSSFEGCRRAHLEL